MLNNNLQEASLGFEKIIDHTDNFSLCGKVEPTFYNFGEKPVLVYSTLLQPGEKFRAGVVGYVMTGSVPIRFMDNEDGSKRELLCYWGVPKIECNK